jgi:hypothetical protein
MTLSGKLSNWVSNFYPNSLNLLYTKVYDNTTSIINTIIGSGSSTYSIIENHILSNTVPFENIIKKAYFEDSEIKYVKIAIT